MPVVLDANLPVPLFYRGKVRDTYEILGKLLLLATDRISAFDFVLPSGIPDKGLVLNQLSGFWFYKTRHICSNHLIAMVISRNTIKDTIGTHIDLPDTIIGRSMMVHKANRISIEAVVRGYISGSAWEEYKNHGTISGIKQSPGMQESQKLVEPIFTPTTKADEGHDLPLNKQELENMLGKELAKKIEDKSISIYNFAADYALERGIIIADTKFEFGIIDNQLSLIDEILTPDSSRFWDIKGYSIGRSQPSFDKQPVRDWLSSSGWNKQPPAPALPEEIIRQTSERYKKAYKILTGKDIIKYD
jgi:phosphoribosylaminoimidazole-succinocarboxamide synthase